MLTSCSGFVYIWRDRKRKMFYVGSHVGCPDDRYTGSSLRFKRAYKKRKDDFKRRILFLSSTITERDLRKVEEFWLSKIKIEELGIKYYNLKRVAAGGRTMESYTSQQKADYRLKLEKSAHTGEEHHRARKVVCFNKIYPTIQEAIKEIGFNPQNRLRKRKFPDFYYFNEGPLSQEEIQAEAVRKEAVKLRGIEIRGRALGQMTPEKRREKALKAAKTRAEKGLGFYKKVSEALKAKPGRKVSLDGVIYEKGRIASEFLGIKYATLKARIRSKSFPAWFYLDNPEKL